MRLVAPLRRALTPIAMIVLGAMLVACGPPQSLREALNPLSYGGRAAEQAEAEAPAAEPALAPSAADPLDGALAGAEDEARRPPPIAPQAALGRAAAPTALGRRRASGPPDARDRAVWAACRPQVIAERCMAFAPTREATGRAFARWRARHAAELGLLYEFIAARGGLFFGDIDRSPLSRRAGDARTQSDLAHENVMLRYCDNARKFFAGDPSGNLTFPTVREAAAEARASGAARRADPSAAAAVRAACQTPLPEELAAR